MENLEVSGTQVNAEATTHRVNNKDFSHRVNNKDLPSQDRSSEAVHKTTTMVTMGFLRYKVKASSEITQCSRPTI